MRKFDVRGPHGGLIGRGVPSAIAKALPKILRKFPSLRIAPMRARHVNPITMYDSVDTAQIPVHAAAVAGYVNGRWPTFRTLERDFPHAHRLSIAVTAGADAETLDVEKYDARPEQAPAWVRRQLKRGVKRPVVYTSVSQAPRLLAELKKAGIKRRQFRLWTAHYTHKPHRCSRKCGFGFNDVADATQYTDRALQRTLDASVVSPHFFA